MDTDRATNVEMQGERPLTDDELTAIAGGEDDEGYPLACPRCHEEEHISLYFGSKKRAYRCQVCRCLFWQDGNGKPYPVYDCD